MNLFDKFLIYFYRRAKGLDDAERYAHYRHIHNIDSTFRFNGTGIILPDEGHIKLGKHSYIGMHSLLLSKENTEITIGDYTSISHYFVIYTKNVVADQDFSLDRKEWVTRAKSVHIGSYCWIGFRVFVIEGVTIGDNVVIGAHSVVTHDLESNGIYAGIPAKLIRKKEPPSKMPK